MKKEIDIGDMAYGRMLALKERELNTAVDKMTKEKRDELRRKLDAMDHMETSGASGKDNWGTAI